MTADGGDRNEDGGRGGSDAGSDAGSDGSVDGTDGGGDGSDGGDGGPATDTACDDELAGALFCSGFESPDIAPWFVAGMGGTGERVTDHTYRGLGAFRGESTEVGGASLVTANVLGGVTSGMIYYRAYVYVPSGTTTSNVSIMAFGQADEPHDGVSVNLEPEGGVRANLNPGGLSIAGDGAALPRDTWTCVQLQVSISPDAGTVRLFVDGELQGERGGLDTLPGTDEGFQRMGAGVVWTPEDHPAGPVVYVDEAVVDTSPLSCD